ncbi:MAG: phosphatase PAP2 family protein [Bacilli bacterium]|nr:phosphatase PAP2 family protein [Bacilli bacterium]
MDKAISTWLASSLNIVISYISLIFTWLSEFGVVVIAFCLTMTIYHAIKNKKLCLTFSFGLLFFGICWLLLDGAGFLPFSIKFLVKRIRPYHEIDGFVLMMDKIHYRHPSSYSFPSGHTFTAFFLATTIFIRWRKWGYVALPLAFMVGFSRIYLGAHYFSDVLVGGILGVGVAIANFFICKLIYSRLEKKEKHYAIR